MNRADYLAAALLLMALALGLSVAVHRLPAEMAYAASLGDQRPPVPQVMPGTLASEGQSRFLPMPGTSFERGSSVVERITAVRAGSIPAPATTVMPDGAIRKDAPVHLSSGTKTCQCGQERQRHISSGVKHPGVALATKERP